MRSISLDVRISINSGAALLIFLAAFFLLIAGVALSPAIASSLAISLGGLTLAFGGYLKKRDSNNKIALQAEQAELGTCPPTK
jgi:hypothetical protein